MKVEKIQKHGDHNKIAWCDNGMGFFLRPGHKIKVGDVINTDVHFIEADVKKLKQEVKDLARTAGKPRVTKYKEWLLAVFEDHAEIPVWKLRAAAKEKGFSWQMITKTRAAELENEIVPSHNKKKGWCWRDVRGVKL